MFKVTIKDAANVRGSVFALAVGVAFSGQLYVGDARGVRGTFLRLYGDRLLVLECVALATPSIVSVEGVTVEDAVYYDVDVVLTRRCNATKDDRP